MKAKRMLPHLFERHGELRTAEWREERVRPAKNDLRIQFQGGS
jgi:hypothetical protein